MSIIWIYAISRVGLSGLYAGQPSCVTKTLMLDISQIFHPNVFKPALYIGIIDFLYFIPLSLPLTLAGRGGGGTKSAQSKVYRLQFLAHFPTDQEEF